MHATSASAGDIPRLRAGERADERQALAERAPRVEVGREREAGSGVDQRARRRHRPPEEERARGEQDGCDVARGQRPDALVAGRFEVVDAPRAELDRERNSAQLVELVAVETKRQPGVAARDEVPARLLGVERAALDEHVRGLGERGCVRQHLGEREVEVRVRVVELGRDGVRAEPRRDAVRVADRLKETSSVSRSSP